MKYSHWLALATVTASVISVLGQTAPTSRPPATRPTATATAPASNRAATAPIGPPPEARLYRFPRYQVPAATQPAEGLTERIYRQSLAWLDAAPKVVDDLVPAAEAAAERLIAGGNLYVAGNGGFAEELITRAGGFPFTQRWSGQELSTKDVLIVGQFRSCERCYPDLVQMVRGPGRNMAKPLVIFLTSHNWEHVQRILPLLNRRWWGDRLHVFDTGAPPGSGMEELCVGQLSTIALAWAFSGEVIAAATRAGKTLATYASDWEPDGAKWDASVREHHLHPTVQVPPIAAGKLGREYLATCRQLIAEFASDQPQQVRLAGRRMAQSMRKGGAVWVISDGHVHPQGAFVPPELPRVLNVGRSFEWGSFAWGLRKGDVLLYMGYLRYPKGTIDNAVNRGADVVAVVVDAGPTTDRITHVRGHWRDWDTIITLPEYPIRVLASSGAIQTPQWYALMAETMAAMAQPATLPASK